MVSSSQNVVIYGTFLMDLRESSPKFQEFWGHPQKWWYLWFFFHGFTFIFSLVKY
jgi:hypothetical protein